MPGLRPGNIGSQTASGASHVTPAAFAGSLAADIEKRVHDLVQAETGKSPFPLNDNSPDARARRALFVAIAQAVVQHLKAHESDGFTVSTSGTHTHSITINVDTS